MQITTRPDRAVSSPDAAGPQRGADFRVAHLSERDEGLAMGLGDFRGPQSRRGVRGAEIQPLHHALVGDDDQVPVAQGEHVTDHDGGGIDDHGGRAVLGRVRGDRPVALSWPNGRW